MENTNTDIPGYVAPGEPKRWYRNAWFSRSFLLVAGLFFLLPFITVKCGGTELASVKGIDLITGNELKPASQKEQAVAEDSSSVDEGVPSGNFTGPMFEQGDQKKIGPNILGIVAFASVILGLIFTFFSKRLPAIIGGGLAILGALSLFFLQVQVHNEVETKLGPFNFAALTVEFTPYYWSCIIFLALAGVFSFVRSSGLKSN